LPLTKLKYLQLRNNPLPQTQVDALQRALPDCGIGSDYSPTEPDVAMS
jgi:hypothetical protein